MPDPKSTDSTRISAVRLHLIPEGCESVIMELLVGRYITLRLATPEEGPLSITQIAANVVKPSNGPEAIMFDLRNGQHQNLVEVIVEGGGAQPGEPFIQLRFRSIGGNCILRIFVPGYAGDQRMLISEQEKIYSYLVNRVNVHPE
jgi:hypothetical protein